MLLCLPSISQDKEEKVTLQESDLDWAALDEITDRILDYAEKFNSNKNSLRKPADKPNPMNDGTRERFSGSALSCRQKSSAIRTNN